jgi:lysyl-tRNA synthetase class 1
MAGGSRESCSTLSQEALGFNPPRGQPYEFVSLIVDGKSVEMTSSGGVSFALHEWSRVAEPEVLKYWYLYMKPMKHLDFSPSKIPHFVNEYDWAEAIHFGTETTEDPEKNLAMKRSYILAHNEYPPDEKPIQIPYDHTALVSQIVPDLSDQEAVLNVLRRTQSIPQGISEESAGYIMKRVERSHYWATKYAPPQYRFEVSRQVPSTIRAKLTEEEVKALHLLADALESQKWTPNDFKVEVYRIAREDTSIGPKRLFQAAYLVFFGQPSGPRLAPFLLSYDEDFVIRRLRELS